MKEVVEKVLTLLTLEMSGVCKTKGTAHKYCTLVNKVVFWAVWINNSDTTTHADWN